MTTYATQADFVARFGDAETLGLCQTIENGEPAIDSASLDTALNDAARIVDSYIAARYPLDLIAVRTTFPEPLRLAVCDLARYLLYKDAPTDQVAQRYKDQIAWLRDVAKGVVGLVFTPPLTVVEQQESVFVPLPAVGLDRGGVFGVSTLSRMPEVYSEADARWGFVNGALVRVG